MNKAYIKLTLFFLLATFSLQAQVFKDKEFGKGMINFTAKDSSFSV